MYNIKILAIDWREEKKEKRKKVGEGREILQKKGGNRKREEGKYPEKVHLGSQGLI